MGNARLLVAAVATLTLLSGCVATPAVPSPAASTSDDATPTDTASAVPDAAVGRVIVRGDSLELVDLDGAVLDTIPYSGDAESAVATLNDAFGTAAVIASNPGDETCTPPSMSASWLGRGFVLGWGAEEKFHPEGQLLSVHVEVPSVGAVAVTTTTGATVGSSTEELASALPDVDRWDVDQYSNIHYDVISGQIGESGSGNPDYWGANAFAVDGVVKWLQAPLMYESVC